MSHPLSGINAGPRRRHAEEMKFAIDTVARLSMYESHRRMRHRSVQHDVFSLY